MSDLQNQPFLASEQYKDSSHLSARIQLHQRFSTNAYGWFNWVFDQFTLTPDAHVLEIGCGPGTLWKENLLRIPRGWLITLSDFSPGMVREAGGNLGLGGITFTYEASDGMAIPFPSKAFDAVVANHMLYHVPQRGKALAEINRVLKPGGKFFATTIGENHLLELSQIMDGFTPTKGKYYSPGLNPGGFTLENGLEQLTPWFDHVSVRMYSDGLVVTEAEPLVAYILSMITWREFLSNKEAVSKLSQIIINLLERHGSIHIQKCSGMFIAEKRDLTNE